MRPDRPQPPRPGGARLLGHRSSLRFPRLPVRRARKPPSPARARRDPRPRNRSHRASISCNG
jgi:hypothetical protein